MVYKCIMIYIYIYIYLHICIYPSLNTTYSVMIEDPLMSDLYIPLTWPKVQRFYRPNKSLLKPGKSWPSTLMKSMSVYILNSVMFNGTD